MDAKAAPRTDDRYVVRAPFDGFMKTIAVRIGDRVRIAEELGQLDTAELEAQLLAAQAEMIALDKRKRLAHIERKQAEAQIAQAKGDAVRARVKLLEHRLRRGRILSPADGTVVHAPSPAQTGMPFKRGDPLFEIRPDVPMETPAGRTAAQAQLKRLEKKKKDVLDALRQLRTTVRPAHPKFTAMKEQLATLTGQIAKLRADLDSRPSSPAPAAGEAYVMGAVAQPGVYSIAGRNIRVLQLLAAAGFDPNKKAGNEVELLRQGKDGRVAGAKLDVAAILAGKKDNLLLRPGDLIVVRNAKGHAGTDLEALKALQATEARLLAGVQLTDVQAKLHAEDIKLGALTKQLTDLRLLYAQVQASLKATQTMAKNSRLRNSPEVIQAMNADPQLQSLRKSETVLAIQRDNVLRKFGPDHELVKQQDTRMKTIRKGIAKREEELTKYQTAALLEGRKNMVNTVRAQQTQVQQEYDKAMAVRNNLQKTLSRVVGLDRQINQHVRGGRAPRAFPRARPLRPTPPAAPRR